MEWILNIEQTYSDDCKKIKKSLSHSRYIHSLSVTKEILDLSKHFDLRLENIQRIGLFHDWAREIEIPELIKFSKHSLIPNFPKEYNKVPILLHGAVSVLFLRLDGIFLPENYEKAIIYHPVGDPLLKIPSLILLISDLIETERNFPFLNSLRNSIYSSKNIFEAAHIVINEKINFSTKNNNKILNCTLKTLEELKKKLNKAY